MKIIGLLGLASALILCTSLESTKLRIEEFAGFDGAEDSPQGKSPVWNVRLTPDHSEEKPVLTYGDFEVDVFSSSQLPSQSLKNYDQIPTPKSNDIVKKSTFKITAEAQEKDLGVISEALFLNICVTAVHKNWNNDEGDSLKSSRVIVSHSIFPQGIIQNIDEISLHFLGMSLLSWTPSELQPSYRYEATAKGKIFFSNEEKLERFSFGNWPDSEWKTIGFQDARKDKINPVMKIGQLGDTLSFSDFRVIAFPGEFGCIRYYRALHNYLQAGLKHIVLGLEKGPQDIQMPATTDICLNVIIVAQQSLNSSDGDVETYNFLLCHLYTTTSLAKLKNLKLFLTHAQAVNDKGEYAPKVNVLMEEETHDGSKKFFTSDTRWWEQKSF